MADATYKTNYENYPSLTIGTTDKKKSFHPFGIALTFNETEKDFKFIFKVILTTWKYIDQVKFRLPKLDNEAKDPGLFFILPCIDDFEKVDISVLNA